MFGFLREIYLNCSNRTFRGILPELFKEPNCSPDTEFVHHKDKDSVRVIIGTLDSVCTLYVLFSGYN